MNLQELAAEALHLSMEERAHLIQQLVLSMESPSEDELKAEWIKEAHRRASELDSGAVKAVSGKEVLQKARALVK